MTHNVIHDSQKKLALRHKSHVLILTESSAYDCNSFCFLNNTLRNMFSFCCNVITVDVSDHLLLILFDKLAGQSFQIIVTKLTVVTLKKVV